MSDVNREEMYPQVLAVYKETESCAEVARRLNMTQQTVWNWLSRAGDLLPSKEERYAGQAIQDYLSGMSYVEVAKKYGVSHSALIKWAEKAGVKGQGGRNARIDSGRQKAITLYQEGNTFKSIAATLKVNPSTVARWTADIEGGREVTEAKDVQEAIRLYEGGATIETIAEALGRGVNKVSEWLHAADIHVLSSLERRTAEEQREYGQKGADAMRLVGTQRTTRLCECCEQEFELPVGKRTSRQRFCSKAHADAYRSATSGKRTTYTCQGCEVSFEGWVRVPRKYCGRRCWAKASPDASKVVVEGRQMDSSSEALFWSLGQLFRIQCDRMNREDVVEWVRGRWYCPDFLVTRGGVSISVEIKGVERTGDKAKWQAWRSQRGRLAVLFEEDLQQLRVAEDAEIFFNMITIRAITQENS